ncbi:glycosyltransferase [Xylophilus sp. Kf1]|nr:glycosyltransferase [Xylophilus sp. Kf1]
MTGLRISVALCTYNGARFVAEQVRSICAQTRLPDQIVLSDDASSDDSVALVRAALTDGLRARPDAVLDLQVIRNASPLGVTRNFEQAIRACTGELIVLCDQDDRWHDHRIERMAERFARRPELLLLHSDARMVDSQGAPLGDSLFHALEVKPFELTAIHDGRGVDVFLRRNLVTGATTMLRRELLPMALPIPPEWLHDEWLALVAAAAGTMDVVEAQWIDYRRHQNNQIGARRFSLREKFRLATQPRGRQYFSRALKVQLLLDRLLTLGDRVSPATLRKVGQKLAHQRFRAGLPAHRPARILPVLREIAAGGYHRFSRPLQAIVQDLFERP